MRWSPAHAFGIGVPELDRLHAMGAGVALHSVKYTTQLSLRGRTVGNTTAAEAMKVTERFRRVNYGRLDIEFSVDDPKAYTNPFTVRINQRIVADGSELIEFICHENQTFLKLTGRAPK